MRIINQLDSDTSGLDSERVGVLEKVASTLYQRLQAIEDRIKLLETKPPEQSRPIEIAPPAPAPAMETLKPVETVTMPETVQPLSIPIAFQGSLDAEAIRKGLLTKMWKYLNDRQAA